MSITLDASPLTAPNYSQLEEEILKTLAYSDIFDYPLTLDQVHKFLQVFATTHEVKTCIEKMMQVSKKENYYFLMNRAEIVQIRKQREIKSKKIFNRALSYGKFIGNFPFVKMVALTGSLAMLNISNEVDMDFMLITKPNRLWLARAFAVTFGRFTRLLGDRICINLLISENALHWKDHDLYTAREICQMIPIAGLDKYHEFRVVNFWTQRILPNVLLNEKKSNRVSWAQNLFEFIFLGKIGDKLEKWAMDFQMKIISRQENISNETNFNTDICQGNFHQHKKWAQIEYEKRMKHVVASHALVFSGEAISSLNEGIASGKVRPRNDIETI